MAKYMTEAEKRKAIFEYVNSKDSTSETTAAIVKYAANWRVRSGNIPVPEHYSEDDNRMTAADAYDPEIPRKVSETFRKGFYRGPTQQAAIDWSEGSSIGLLIFGKSVGKTLSACMTIHSRWVDGVGTRAFVSESQLVRDIFLKPTSTNQSPLQKYAVRRLVVDHMGALGGGREGKAVVEYLRVRWETGRENVLTTRMSLEQFEKCYGDDAWSTITRFCTKIEAEKPRPRNTGK